MQMDSFYPSDEIFVAVIHFSFINYTIYAHMVNVAVTIFKRSPIHFRTTAIMTRRKNKKLYLICRKQHKLNYVLPTSEHFNICGTSLHTF